MPRVPGRVLALLTIVLFISSCVSVQAKNEPLRFVTWTGGAEKALEDEVLDMFRARYPDIPVNYETVPGGGMALGQFIVLNLASGAQLDMAVTHTNWLQPLMNQGALLDLRPFIERDHIDLSKFPAGVIDSYKGPNGEIYALPFQWTTIVLGYNKDYIDRFGLAYPSNNWNVFDLYDAAKKLSIVSSDKRVEGYGLQVEKLDEYVWRLWGVPFLSADRKASGWTDPRAVEAWKWYGAIHQDTATGGGATAWPAGKVALRLTWPHTLTNAGKAMTDAWDICLHPYGANNVRVARGAGAQWVIFKGTKNPESAWTLMKFLISPEAQYQLLLRGRGGVYIPAMMQYWRHWDAATNGISNPNTLLNRHNIFDAYAYASLEPVPVNYDQLLSQIVAPMARKIASGAIPAETAVPEAARQITARIP